MLHLGPRTFDEISGEVVQSTAFVIKNIESKNSKGTYFKLTDYRNSEAKHQSFLERKHCFNSFSQSSFEKVPGSSISAYWLNDKSVDLFEESNSLSDLANFRTGITTGDNVRFMKLWFEISSKEIQADCYPHSCPINKWVFCKSGSNFRKYPLIYRT